MVGREVRVRYKGSTVALTVRLIHTWHRDDIEMAGLPIMGASGGPKEMLKNDVWVIFNKDLDIVAVSMVRAGASPFYIIRKGDRYYDVTQKEVEVSAPKAAKAPENIRPADTERQGSL